ncbi:MAG: gliding motility-associated C-terminal domain-containing protein, partial [Bacteroidetes bacterium]|nr:gliding motility-associated C-terminal domain-containing protein [Bacteroidota bacterium]
NGDGTNDVFALGAVGAVDAKVQVYDRWGTLVHSGNLLRQPWNGTDDRTSEPVPNGTYYYVLQLVDSNGKGKEVSGYFTVLR